MMMIETRQSNFRKISIYVLYVCVSVCFLLVFCCRAFDYLHISHIMSHKFFSEIHMYNANKTKKFMFM